VAKTFEGKTVTLDRSVLDGKTGINALKLIETHVHVTLALPYTDNTTRVQYWDSGFWNVPASIAISAKTGKYNGGFIDRVSAAINGRVVAQKDTNAQPTTGTVATDSPKKPEYIPVATKTLKINVVTMTTVRVIHPEFEIVINRDSTGNTKLIDVDIVTVATHAKRIQQIVSELESTFRKATEIDPNGNPCVDGWNYGSYVSNQPEHDAALMDILNQCVAKMDKKSLMLLSSETAKITRNATGKKYELIVAWFPAKTEPEPSQPTQTPTDATDVIRSSDTGLSSPDATVPTKPVDSTVPSKPGLNETVAKMATETVADINRASQP
jgi:hypothetical protein